MKQILHCVFILFFLFTFPTAYADDSPSPGIITDGSIGTAGITEIPGPDYEISPEYGQQIGSNLFHSFQQFNLHSDENATFSGPSTVQNIISRITGGQISWIDGQIISVIEGADLYLLNPSGFMFGPNASLDISGSFHVSTADYLRMGEKERFYSEPLAGEVLSVAPPSAFGFLGNNSGSISVEGRGWISEEEWNENYPTGLQVPDGETLSLIGGNIEISNGTFYETELTDEDGNPYYVQETDEYGWPLYEIETDEEGEYRYDEEGYPVYALDEYGEYIPILILDEEGNSIPETEIIRPGEIAAPGGRINLAAVSSAGEVIPTTEGLDISAEEMGNISFSENALADVSGEGGGAVFIRSGIFVMDKSGVLSHTYGKTDGKGIDIRCDELEMNGGAYLKANTFDSGTGGNIMIDAGDIRLSGEDDRGYPSWIVTNSWADTEGGAGGKVDIRAENIRLQDGAQIQAGTLGQGKGGTIKVEALGSVTLSGESSYGDLSGIVVNSQSESEGAGNAGNIEIAVAELFIEDGAHIASSAWKGDGGNIDIRVSGSVTVSGEDSWGFPSVIESAGIGAGTGGAVFIQAENLLLEKGGTVNAITDGEGRGGSITVEARNRVQVSGETQSGEYASSIAASTQKESGYAGEAGSIEIRTGELLLESGGQISCGSFGPGNGGNVTVTADTVKISGTGVSNPEFVSAILVTAQGGEEAGNGGDIELTAGSLRISENGAVGAGTFGSGTGGDILIRAGEILLHSGGRMEAESEGSGDAGNIGITGAGNVVMEEGKIATRTTEADGGNISLTSAGYLYMTDSSINTSVEAEFGDGGNIRLDTSFVILNSSSVIARAAGGDGGNIDIFTNAIYRFPPESQSPIDASSQLGVDGIVRVNSPESDISSSLTVLPSSFMDATQWAKTPCAARTGENVSTFTLSGPDAVPSALDDWQHSPLTVFNTAAEGDSMPAKGK